jgi:radical SAM/Cys-rich protein
MRFREKVEECLSGPIMAQGLEILQVNLGYRCNMSCKHCHIEAGPSRGEEMGRDTVDAVISVLVETDIGTLDLTGGAPELNPHFERLSAAALALGRRVIVRSNLTVLLEEGSEWLAGFFLDNDVEVVASLPYYIRENVDRVRGTGTFDKCMEALRRLNEMGYGGGAGGKKMLKLVYNPQGAFLSPPQEELECRYREVLGGRFGVSFDGLYSISNMTVGRFKGFLERVGLLREYHEALVSAFNPGTLDGLMCRQLINVGWDGRLYDCDFNQALGQPLLEGLPGHITDFRYDELSARGIAVEEHCFGCTAGQGST